MEIKINHIKGCFDEFEKDGVCSFTLTDATEGRFTHERALEYASAKGMRLLTKEEIHLSVAAGVLNQGDKSFWSSSVRADNQDSAWLFYGYYGSFSFSNRFISYAVRCAGR